MSKYYYETPIDSPTGKRISAFWQRCIRCERAAESYAKRMGGKFYYQDPRYFAGGVVCIAFADGKSVDKGMWRQAGVDRNDGVSYYEPDVQTRSGMVEIPSRDYEVHDSYDRYYDREHIVEREVTATDTEAATEPTDGASAATTRKLYVPYVEFYRDEPPGHSGSGIRQASRGLRKAIKAEVKRRRLPMVRVEELLAIFSGGDNAKPADAQRQPSTPTFFPYRSRYFIGCDCDCSGNADLTAITPQQHLMNQKLAELAASRQLA